MPEANCKPLPPITEKDKRRFWEKVQKGGPDECWPWLGARSEREYGVFEFPAQTTRACRVAYFIQHGEDPFPFLIRHTCDHPWCENGAHLLKGTHDQNMEDMVSRNRAATGDRNGNRLHPELLARGSKHKNSKLTENQIVEIRKLFNEGITCTTLADQFQVSINTVSRIVHGTGWLYASGETVATPLTRHGTAHYRARLTEDLVREIRAKYAAGGRSYQSLANEYSMGLYTVFALIKRRTWKHVQ